MNGYGMNEALIGVNHAYPDPYMNSRRSYPQDAFRPVSDSYFTGLAMHGGDRLAYADAKARARPIIAQWSEWEQQTRMEAWR